MERLAGGAGLARGLPSRAGGPRERPPGAGAGRRGGRKDRAARAGRARGDRARAGQAAGARQGDRDRRIRRGRVPGPGRRLRAECGRGRSRCRRSALGHRRRLLPLPGQVPVPSRGGVRRHAWRSRLPEGDDQGRRVLRADGGVLRLRRGARSRRRRRGRRRRRRRRDVPGLRGGGAVLSADHQDGLAAAAHGPGRHRRRRGPRGRRVELPGLRRRGRGSPAIEPPGRGG